ncbi:MAG: AtpZ/AtpI family protein [bacterium]|nr:AtpZ/AtpI family protein [bacterium]
MPDDRQGSLWVALGFAWRLGYSIAVPLVILLALGRSLDRRLGTEPWLLISGLVLSFILTNILMFREAVRVLQQTEAADRAKPTPPRSPAAPSR